MPQESRGPVKSIADFVQYDCSIPARADGAQLAHACIPASRARLRAVGFSAACTHRLVIRHQPHGTGG